MKQLNFTLKLNGKVVGQLVTTPIELLKLGYVYKLNSFHKTINNESVMSAILN